MHNDEHDQDQHTSATVLGQAVFEQLRKRIEAEARARRHAVAARTMAMQKRVVSRLLNKELDKPRLRIVK